MTKEIEQMSEMQHELLNRADVIFAKVYEAAAKATDFASEQLPDIAFQFIAYNRAYLTTLIVFSVVFLPLSIWMFRMSAKTTSEDVTVLYFFGGVIPAFLSGFIFLVNFKDFMLVWFAPKIFLITEIVHLVRGVK